MRKLNSQVTSLIVKIIFYETNNSLVLFFISVLPICFCLGQTDLGEIRCEDAKEKRNKRFCWPWVVC
jgi:hypothetical protein